MAIFAIKVKLTLHNHIFRDLIWQRYFSTPQCLVAEPVEALMYYSVSFHLACRRPNPNHQGQGFTDKSGVIQIFSATPPPPPPPAMTSTPPPRRERYKLVSEFSTNSVTHRTVKSDLRSRQRRIEVRTTWATQRVLGAGAFGEVRLEREQGTGELRAVKAIAKMQVNTHEVEALIDLQDVCIVFPRLWCVQIGD